MDETDYEKKYQNLRILKSIQDYLKSESDSTSVYPIKVPDDLLLQVLKHQGPKAADDLINQIFKVGLTIWSEKLYSDSFGSTDALNSFIEVVKKRSKESK
ncbi:hypothetical protein OAC89_07270 [Deltaproteobacteria bacterium]|nr:hypothetical protein [Deltaproteobacteria bacterium]